MQPPFYLTGLALTRPPCQGEAEQPWISRGVLTLSIGTYYEKPQFPMGNDDRGVGYVHSAGPVAGPRSDQRLAMLLNLQRRADSRHGPDMLGLPIQHVVQGECYEKLPAV